MDTQLIAHDKEVYDIAWGGKGVFASVSADGSVRVFDLRYCSLALLKAHIRPVANVQGILLGTQSSREICNDLHRALFPFVHHSAEIGLNLPLAASAVEEGGNDVSYLYNAPRR